MSEWKELPKDSSDYDDCQQLWTLVVEYKPDGNPAVWVRATHRARFWTNFWEMTLAIPRDGDGVDTVKVRVPADRRNECAGKTREQLIKLFELWGAE